MSESPKVHRVVSRGRNKIDHHMQNTAEVIVDYGMFVPFKGSRKERKLATRHCIAVGDTFVYEKRDPKGNVILSEVYS